MNKAFIYFCEINSIKICFFIIVINLCFHPNLISLIYLLTFYLYSLIENPFPPPVFWLSFMTFNITVISLKFLYQLPFFCGTPQYAINFFQQCDMRELTPEVLFNRIDYIIGIKKYSGPSSYPKN